MSAKTQITADFATPNDVASRLRVSAARAKELRKQVFDMQVQNGDSIVFAGVKAPKTSSPMTARHAVSGRASRSKKK